MWKFISRRTDKRIDSQLNKQLSALVSTFAVYTGLEAQNFTAKCGSAISSFSIPAFSSHSSSSSLSYCAEVMGFSVTMSVITLVVVITTPSVPPKERKSAKAEALSFKQLAKSGGKLFENVKSSKDALSKKSAEAYKKRSLSRSRASARSNNSGSKPYEFTGENGNAAMTKKNGLACTLVTRRFLPSTTTAILTHYSNPSRSLVAEVKAFSFD
jgi:hypothetical protein